MVKNRYTFAIAAGLILFGVLLLQKLLLRNGDDSSVFPSATKPTLNSVFQRKADEILDRLSLQSIAIELLQSETSAVHDQIAALKKDIAGVRNPLSVPELTEILKQQRVAFLEAQAGRERVRVGKAFGSGPGYVDMIKTECTDPEFRQSQYKEDLIVFDMFFNGTHDGTGKPKANGVFLEMGALNGQLFSNSYFYEYCLGWSGLLIEGHPDLFAGILDNRPGPQVARLNMANCPSDGSSVEFTAKGTAVGGIKDMMTESFLKDWGHAHGNGTIPVPCGPLSKYLELVGIEHIDFFSLDVEGSEVLVLETIDWSKLSVHVLLVETNVRDKEVEDLLRPQGFLRMSDEPVPHSNLFVNSTFWAQKDQARRL